jgi:hypothetical protein
MPPNGGRITADVAEWQLNVGVNGRIGKGPLLRKVSNTPPFPASLIPPPLFVRASARNSMSHSPINLLNAEAREGGSS